MTGLNEVWFVFYYRDKGSNEPYQVSQPFTMGEIIDGELEMDFENGDSLPFNDIDWGNADMKFATIPARKPS